MDSESPIPGSAEDWLRYAKSDLELARIEKPEGVLLENLCFHAQQAAEKTLKAALIFLEIDFPRTHNIRTLLDLLPEGVDVPQEVEESSILTDYAVESRYPRNSEPVDDEEYRQVLGLAETVVSWGEKLIYEIDHEQRQ
ncbi:MAG: HEPN domain-containing protein [Gemmatimonadetes bacterium]|nr:HEPN domain-containing protein [Gemmatimonadota bacterium]